MLGLKTKTRTKHQVIEMKMLLGIISIKNKRVKCFYYETSKKKNVGKPMSVQIKLDCYRSNIASPLTFSLLSSKYSPASSLRCNLISVPRPSGSL